MKAVLKRLSLFLSQKCLSSHSKFLMFEYKRRIRNSSLLGMCVSWSSKSCGCIELLRAKPRLSLLSLFFSRVKGRRRWNLCFALVASVVCESLTLCHSELQQKILLLFFSETISLSSVQFHTYLWSPRHEVQSNGGKRRSMSMDVCYMNLFV